MEREKTLQEIQIENLAKQLASKRINKVDQEVLRNTFAGNIDAILAIRNLFFGMATDEEKDNLERIFASPEAKRVMRKILLPELASTDPLKQSIDLWQTIKIDDKDDDRITDEIAARAKLIDMLEWSLGLLEDVTEKPVDLRVDPKKANYASLTARNTFISHVETQLVMTVTLAMTTEESEEEKQARLKKNSSK